MGVITKLLTKNYTDIPLFSVTFDYRKFQDIGNIGSCMAHIHPVIKNDEYVTEEIKKLIDYIRNNYDMDKMP